MWLSMHTRICIYVNPIFRTYPQPFPFGNPTFVFCLYNYPVLHLLCTLGITMYAVGVGKAIEEELQEIASEPTEKHLFYAEDFSTMGEISDKLQKGICEGTADYV